MFLTGRYLNQMSPDRGLVGLPQGDGRINQANVFIKISLNVRFYLNTRILDG